MSLRLKPGLRVFVYPEYIDLRAGFDRLSMVVREKMGGKVMNFTKLTPAISRKRTPLKSGPQGRGF